MTNRLTLLIAVVSLLVAPSASAQLAALADPMLLRRLERPVTLAWSGQTLTAALTRLAEAQNTPVWLDRRIDPSTLVELSASDEPLRDVLSRWSGELDLGVVPFRSVIYVGPRRAADELATLAMRARDALEGATPAVRTRWLKAAPWSYPRLSEPRRLLRELAEATGASVAGEELVPHDLWPARSLPSMTAVDRVVLLLADFDLTCEIAQGGKELRVVPIKRPVAIARRYAARDLSQPEFKSELAHLPAERVRDDGSQIVVSGRWEDHQRLQAALRPAKRGARPAPTKPRKSATQKYTLKIENQPVDRVVNQLAQQLKLTVEWAVDPPSGAGGLVSCDVRQVDLDALLGAILNPVGLTHKRTGDQVSIQPAP